MNTNFADIIKRIIAEQGEAILGDPARLKGFVADYAPRERKVERIAFGRCIEYGAYTELKDAEDREVAKAAIARRVNANEGTELALCNDALNALEAALFGGAKPKKALCLKCGRELEPDWKACPFCRAEIYLFTKLADNSSGGAGRIYVRGSDVYVAGFGWVDDKETRARATYWKNGQPVRLSNSSSMANSICVSGSDVYVARQEEVDGGGIASQRTVYWKNGRKINLE